MEGDTVRGEQTERKTMEWKNTTLSLSWMWQLGFRGLLFSLIQSTCSFLTPGMCLFICCVFLRNESPSGKTHGLQITEGKNLIVRQLLWHSPQVALEEKPLGNFLVKGFSVGFLEGKLHYFQPKMCHWNHPVLCKYELGIELGFLVNYFGVMTVPVDIYNLYSDHSELGNMKYLYLRSTKHPLCL